MEGMDDERNNDGKWQLILKGNQLTKTSCHPPRYEQVKEHNFQENVMK
jgi:hypothetical protein